MLDILGSVPVEVYAVLVAVLVIGVVGFFVYRSSWWQRRLMVRDDLMLNGADERLQQLQASREVLDADIRQNHEVYSDRKAKLLERRLELGIDELEREIPKLESESRTITSEIKEINRAVARAEKRRRRFSKKSGTTAAVKRLPMTADSDTEPVNLAEQYDAVIDRPEDDAKLLEDVPPARVMPLTPPSDETFGSGSHSASLDDDRRATNFQA